MDIEKVKKFSLDKIKEETLAKYVRNVIKNEEIKKQDYREGFKRYYNQNQDRQSDNITDWLDKIKINKFSNLSNLGNIIRDKLAHDSIKNKSYFSNDVLDNLERLNYNILRLVNKPPPIYRLEEEFPPPLQNQEDLIPFPPPPPPLQEQEDLIPLPPPPPPLQEQEDLIPLPPPPPPLQEQEDLIPLPTPPPPLQEQEDLIPLPTPPPPLQVKKIESNILDEIRKGKTLKPVKKVESKPVESKPTNTLSIIFNKMRNSIAPDSSDDDDDDEINYFSD